MSSPGERQGALFVAPIIIDANYICSYKKMAITFDPVKRKRTFTERGLDFADAAEVFKGLTVSGEDMRTDYGEIRIVTVGHLRGRMVIVVWTPRGENRHVFSMRKANEREQQRYRERLG